MSVFTTLFFWAFVGMFGLLIGTALSRIKPGQNRDFCESHIMIAIFPIILVFAVLPPASFEISIWN